MSEGFEVAGDTLTGGVLASAVEPRHGATTAGRNGVCLNCGAAVHGAYCGQCGQATKLHRTLGSIGHDILHGVFHFEGKIWRTLPMLLFKPGALTRRYVHGERARFVSPLALFLFTMFLMFGVIHALAGEFKMPDVNPVDLAKPALQVARELSDAQAKAKTLRANIKQADAKDIPTEKLDAALDTIENRIDSLTDAQNQKTGKKPAFVGFNTGLTAVDNAIKKANGNPDLLIYKLQANAYKYSWALIPLSVPFVWLLFFWRRDLHLYDHAVFVTYSLTFMCLLTIALTIAGFSGAPMPWVPILGVFVPPLHTYRQLRGAYRSGGISSAIRTLLLMSFGIVVLTLFFTTLITLGIMG
ncbi:MAG: DUF3667 domain-containing protein [Sphingomonadales bacterium]